MSCGGLLGVVSKTSCRLRPRCRPRARANSRLWRKRSHICACSASCARKCCSVLCAKGRSSTADPNATFELRSIVVRRCASASLTRSCACSNRAVASRLGDTVFRPLSLGNRQGQSPHPETTALATGPAGRRNCPGRPEQVQLIRFPQTALISCLTCCPLCRRSADSWK